MLKLCYRCENKSYTFCKSCVKGSNFKEAWTQEEYKQKRKEEKKMKKLGSLEALIPQYAKNKFELDSYKKICDKENAEIKSLMLNNDMQEASAGGYTAKLIIQHRDSMNEDKLLEIAHNFGISEIVKTKEYIDFDALENAIYNNLISQEVLLEMDKAKETKEVVTLKIGKTKQEEK